MRRALRPGTPWLAWVAVRGDAIVGTLWLGHIAKLPNPVPEPELHAYVTNVYVAPEERGSGLGARLMEKAVGWCDARDVDRTILWPTRRSRTLYARYGFGPPRDLMERD
jgi:GNAT superfamily N-acetyltransferase